MPCSSSARRRVRSAQAAAFALQDSLVCLKNVSSDSSCSFKSFREDLLSASFFVFSAESFSDLSKVASSAFSSCFLVAIKSSKAFCLLASCTLSFSRSPVKESYMQEANKQKAFEDLMA